MVSPNLPPLDIADNHVLYTVLYSLTISIIGSDPYFGFLFFDETAHDDHRGGTAAPFQPEMRYDYSKLVQNVY